VKKQKDLCFISYYLVISAYIATQQQDSSLSLCTLVYRPLPSSGLS